GLAFLELFDVDRNTDVRVGYVGLRSTVSAAGGSALAGLAMTNSAAKQILIRAIGPTLGAGVGVTNPGLTIRDNLGAVVASNDDWNNTPSVIAATTGT